LRVVVTSVCSSSITKRDAAGSDAGDPLARLDGPAFRRARYLLTLAEFGRAEGSYSGAAVARAV
jgi:hypothetical protein